MSLPCDVDQSADIDIATAATILNTSPKFIRRRIADGTLKAYRLKGSRLIRIDRADLEALKQPITGGSVRGSVESARPGGSAAPTPREAAVAAKLAELPGGAR